MTVELSCDLGVATLRLNRPEKLNALSFDILAEIDLALGRVSPLDARVLLVTGAGDRAFCAGADIEELRDREIEAQRAGARFGQAVFEKLARLPLMSIAALNGYAFGGGLELALACTFRVAAQGARLGLPEIKLGLIPGYGGTQRLPRLVGEARALEIILTGRTVGAEEAHRIGLVDRLADGEDAHGAALALAASFTGYSLPILALARDAVIRGADLPIAEGLRLEADLSTLAYQTRDAAEGLAAFTAKRPAEFQDA